MESKMKVIASFPWCTMYAKRTIVGGLAYFTDDVGGGQLVVDMTTVDPSVIKFISDNHDRIDKIFDKIHESVVQITCRVL